jgi:type II secretory ATPase GspE/PulE/Tfp pilus assembly ATPase PilB-like protein
MAEENNKEYESPEHFFNVMFENAVKDGASDIHIEPLLDRVRVRFRIDGKLQEKFSRPFYEHEQIVNRIKVLADLDLTSKPVPQDGHFELVSTSAVKGDEKVVEPVQSKLADKLNQLLSGGGGSDPTAGHAVVPSASQGKKTRPTAVDVRVSIFPTLHGEAVVMRLLNSQDMIMSLAEFEMNEVVRSKLKRLITKNHGMMLVTGPAGSGKTSMLYSVLKELQSVDKNIITLEDPVEFDLEGVRQSPIKPEVGLTFSAGMKSILRQDPDIIMIGEIRDPETAEYATRASLMGRLVFSTVHSNSSVGIIARLIDMGIERSLVAYALNGSISKRLVRRVCQNCKTTYSPDSRLLQHFGIEKFAGHKFVKGAGCNVCHGTGYKSRIGIFELMEIDDNMRSLIIEKAPMNVLQSHVEKSGMQTLLQDALEKVIAGETTLDEAVGAV